MQIFGSSFSNFYAMLQRFLTLTSPPTANLTLFYSQYSPPARAVYMVAKELNLNIELKHLNILSLEYLTPELTKMNPQHCVPTLKDGNFVLWESHAIAGYLVGQYGKDDSLYPKNPKQRAVVDQRLHFDTEILFPRASAAICPILFRGKTNLLENCKNNIEQAYSFLEQFLHNSTWLAGNHLTIADLSCISSISTLDTVVPVLKTNYPKLKKYIHKCTALPYYNEINQIGVDNLGNKIQQCLVDSYLKQYRYKDRERQLS